MKLKSLSLGAGCLALSLAANAAVIDFDGGGISGSYTSGPVTFTSANGGPGVYSSMTPNGTNGLLEMSSPYQLIRADIAGGTNQVSVDLGDYNSDQDLLVLRVYDSFDNLLGETTHLIDYSFIGMFTLSLAAPDIAYAVFGSLDPSIDGSSVYADNFSYAQAVPEPETYAMLMAGLGLLGAVARRRSRAA